MDLSSQLIGASTEQDIDEADRTEPDLAVYADTLLVIDLLERHVVEYLERLSPN